MDLCTVVNKKFILHALNLIKSYKLNSYNQKIYLYYFNTGRKSLEIFTRLFGGQVTLIEVKKTCSHALDPLSYFYKVYAIYDCLLNHSAGMIYSDAANCFIKKTDTLAEDLIDESLFLSYNHPLLANQYWTTEGCFKVINAPAAETMMQYWAGFQVYKKTNDNINFVSELYDIMLDPRVALPGSTVRFPDGSNKKCIEHRQDQSALSILIHKHNRHQSYDPEKTAKYGDWQTIIRFDKGYKPEVNKIIVSPREAKSYFRYLQVKRQ